MNGELPNSVLKSVIWGDNMGLDESADADELPNPFEMLMHAGAVRAQMAKSSGNHSVVFDWGVPPVSDIDDDVSSPLYKSPVIVPDAGPRTLAKKLGIVRTERVTSADGTVWIHAFNSRNELVDARVLLSRD